MTSITHELEIATERARILHSNAVTSLAGGIAIAATLFYVGIQQAPGSSVLTWSVLYLGTSVLRLWLWFSYRHRLDTHEDAARWQKYMIIALTLSGLTWSYGVWSFMTPAESIETAMIVAIIACLIGGSMGALAPSLKAYIAYCAPIGLTTSLALYWVAEWNGYLALFFLFYPLICVLYTRVMENTIIQSIELRFENEELINQLSEQSALLAEDAKREADANAAKSRFLAVASHDIAQPLHAIELFLGALQYEQDPVRQRSLIDQASNSASVLAELFESLLDISKLEAKAVSAELEDIHFSEILEPLIDDSRNRAELKGLELILSVEDAVICTDRFLLQRALMNIVGNAIQFTERGSITIRSLTTDGEYRVQVKDTGIGIEAENLANVYKEYYQGPGSEGTGLGLAIVKGICELIDARVDIESQVNTGTTVTLSFAR